MRKYPSQDPEEIARFEETASEWWDETGPSAPLHAMAPARIGFLKDQISGHFGNRLGHQNGSLRVLDVGCGGGLVCEPLARLGHHVTGIDAGETAINVARQHAQAGGLNIDYRNIAIETFDESFDVVLALEIIEHVNDPGTFVAALKKCVVPGGLVIFSTLNRTLKAWGLAIMGAEYIARQLPIGTHNYDKFVKPSELAGYCRSAGLEPLTMTGLRFDLRARDWKLTQNCEINYFLTAKPSLDD